MTFVRRELRSIALAATLVLVSWGGESVAKRTTPGSSEGSVVTYSGMAVHEDRAVTLRVELSRAVKVRSEKRGKNLSFFLDGATVRQRTNLFPLVADHFQVAVLSTKLDRARGGVRFSVSLREAVEPPVRLVEHDAGATLLVELPPYVPKEAPPPAPAKPAGVDERAEP